MPQVVIVGAGPTGATLALLLVQRGITVTLVEAAKDFQRVFRGEGLMPSGLDALEQMGVLPLVEQIPHRPLTAWEFFLEGQSLFRVNEPMGAPFPCTLIAQPPLLEALVKAAQSNGNFEFIPGVRVNTLLWSDDRVTGVKLSDSRTIAAELVVGADGRNSLVRDRAGLTLNKRPKPIDVLWFKVPSHPSLEVDSVFCTCLQGKNVFSVFHGAEAGYLHLAWVLTSSTIPQGQSANWAEVFANGSPSWLAEHFRNAANALQGPLHLPGIVGRCSRWYQPGVLLLGDAAHPMSPVRAQGINLALRDVIVAVNHLTPLLTTNAGVNALDQALKAIQAEREPEIIRAQQLQRQEMLQGEILGHSPLLRQLLLYGAPWLSTPLQKVWSHRQHPLRQGIATIKLKV